MMEFTHGEGAAFLAGLLGHLVIDVFLVAVGFLGFPAVQRIRNLLSCKHCHPDQCVWETDDLLLSLDRRNWETDCGHHWSFFDGSPSDNEAEFCPFCGRKIKEADDG